MRVSLYLLALMMLLPTAAQAWGRKGHAAVAALAESHLTPAARDQVQRLLTDDLDRDGKPSGRKTLAAIASWPDEIRDIAADDAYKGWHVRSNPVCSDALGRCRDGHCVDQLIIHYSAVLKDRDQPQRVRNEALKWVVHLVGDLHQPLHSGINRDGGGIAAGIAGQDMKPGSTLHTLWDNEISVLALKLGPLQFTPAGQQLADDAATRWMIEAREVALHVVYEPLPGFSCEARLKAPLMLDETYLKQAATTAHAQMSRAGSRLAQLLNEALDPAAAP